MDNKQRLIVALMFFGVFFASFGTWWWRKSEITGSMISPDVVSITGTKVTPTISESKDLKIINKLKDMVASASGTYAIYVYDLDKKASYGVNERKKMHGASILKLPAIAAVYRKASESALSLNDLVTMNESDRRLGAGPLQYASAGASYSYKKLISLMGKSSDNTAWVMINRSLGNSVIEDEILDLGMTDTYYKELQTTAVDVGKLFVKIYSGGATGVTWEDFSQNLVGTAFEDRITVGVPSEGVIASHKVGTLEDAWMDAGVVECSKSNVQCPIRPFVVVIMNTGVKIDEAKTIVPKLVREIWKNQIKT